MKYNSETPGNNDLKINKLKHYKKINIFGDEGVGKSSLISLMEHFGEDNFVIKEKKLSQTQISLGSINEVSSIVESIKRVKMAINEDKPLYLNIYETNLDDYDTIKINLDTLLLQTECIIIMWDISKNDSFDNISNLFFTINQGMKDNKFRNAPIFLIQNKMDLNEESNQRNEKGNNIKDSIEKMKEENPNIVYREVSLLNKEDFFNLMLDINRNLFYNEKEKLIINDAANLVKFKYYKNSSEFQFIDTNIEIKCILLGYTGVGKTTFFNYFLGKKSQVNTSTAGFESLKLLAEVNKEQFYFSIYDTAGQERFQSITKNYIRDSQGILLFFDVTKKESFLAIDKIISEIGQTIDNFEIILLANKIDRNDKREISKADAIAKANEYGMKYFECCCLSGLNLYEILNEIILAGYRKYKSCEEENNELFKRNTQKLEYNNQKNEKKKGYCCYYV